MARLLAQLRTMRTTAAIAYWNRRLPTEFTWRGDLSNVSSDDTIWVNNVAWANPAFSKHNTALLDADSKNVVWRNNLTFNGKPGDASVGGKLPADNLFGRDPRLVDAATTDFRLQRGSPAISAGTAKYGAPKVDLDGNPRKGRVDIGAYAAAAKKR